MVADLFTIDAKQYLAYVDGLREWPIVHVFNGAAIPSADDIKSTQLLFIRLGIPNVSWSPVWLLFASSECHFLKCGRYKRDHHNQTTHDLMEIHGQVSIYIYI